MLFHFTPHIYTLGELMKEEGSQTEELAVSCGSSEKSVSGTKGRIETGLLRTGC